MSVLESHKSLRFYLIVIHVPTINKALNLNLNQILRVEWLVTHVSGLLY